MVFPVATPSVLTTRFPATSPEQVKTNAATAEWRLTPDEVDEVGALVA